MCRNKVAGFSIGYPRPWYVATPDRVRSPGTTTAYKKRLLGRLICFNFDRHPFVVIDGSELPRTAIEIWRPGDQPGSPYNFGPDCRSLRRRWVRVGGHRALQYEIHCTYQVMGGEQYRYGYKIALGHRRVLEIDAVRYIGSSGTSQALYLQAKHIVDQMAPTVSQASEATAVGGSPSASTAAWWIVRSSTAGGSRAHPPRPAD